jgi:hypothetical protein
MRLEEALSDEVRSRDGIQLRSLLMFIIETRLFTSLLSDSSVSSIGVRQC